MATAQVVVTSASQETPAVGGVFDGLNLFLVQRLPSRSSFVVRIQGNGGRVVKFEGQANHIIADHLRPDCPAGSISYTFIEAAIKHGKLPDPNDHLAGRPPGTARGVASGLPIKSTRTPFTAEEDRILWSWVQKRKAEGSAVKGNEIYKDLETKYPRHTSQSWRDRYIKKLMDNPPPPRPDAPPANEITRAAPLPQSPRQTRTPFTAEEDRILWRFVEQRKSQGLAVKGDVIYKQLEGRLPAHTWQSWKDRYVKKLMHNPPEGVEEKVDANARPSPPIPQEEQEEVRANSVTQPPEAVVKDKTVAMERSDLEENGDLEEAQSKNEGDEDDNAEAEFGDEDFEELIVHAEHIEAVADDQIDDAWTAWAQTMPEHSALSWRRFYEDVVRPKHLKAVAEQKVMPARDLVRDISAVQPPLVDGINETEGSNDHQESQETRGVRDTPRAARKAGSRSPTKRKPEPATNHERKKRKLERSTTVDQVVSDMEDANAMAHLPLPVPTSDAAELSSNLPTSELNEAADQQLRRESLEHDSEMEGMEEGDDSNRPQASDVPDSQEGEPVQSQIDLQAPLETRPISNEPSQSQSKLLETQINYSDLSSRYPHLPQGNDSSSEVVAAESHTAPLKASAPKDYSRRKIPLDQQVLLDSPSSWYPSLPGHQFPRPNVPISLLQRWDAEASANAEKAAKRPNQILAESDTPLNEPNVINANEKSLFVGSSSGSEEPSEEEDLASRWSKSPPEKSRHLPPDSPQLSNAEPSSRVEAVEDEIDLDIPEPGEGWPDSSPLAKTASPRVDQPLSELWVDSPSLDPASIRNADEEMGDVHVIIDRSSKPSATPNTGSSSSDEDSDLVYNQRFRKAFERLSSHPDWPGLSEIERITVVEAQVAQDAENDVKLKRGKDDNDVSSDSSSRSAFDEEPDHATTLHAREQHPARGFETQDILNAETPPFDFEMPLPPNSDRDSGEHSSDVLSRPISPSNGTTSGRPRDSADTQPLADEDLEPYIHRMVLDGFKEASVINALKCTSMRPHLAERVLEEEMAGRGLPEVQGVWSEEEDKTLEFGGSPRAVKKLEEKHTWAEVDMRMQFLESYREVVE